ncbi:hypothetical protein [Enterococcus dongliensis]|uniref:hypothetical protein n=1 Tax=Enterococcus dongliensis TaxID=2559925 RepID=UPI0028908A7D|nr:hypothetical protein [Enterococcus dongliensis]MDT2673580.1 hypothetical protein [Enterococcus dongliensis]
MIRKRKIINYYMKKQGFTKHDANKTADKTRPEFIEARTIYLTLFNDTKPTFADRTEHEKILRVYQVFSSIALFCYIIWLFLNGYLSRAQVADNFLLILLLINLAIISLLNEKITEKIHDKKINKLFQEDPEALKKLLRIEEIKREVFRAEYPEIKLVENRKQTTETINTPETRIKIFFSQVIEKLKSRK